MLALNPGLHCQVDTTSDVMSSGNKTDTWKTNRKKEKQEKLAGWQKNNEEHQHKPDRKGSNRKSWQTLGHGAHCLTIWSASQLIQQSLLNLKPSVHRKLSWKTGGGGGQVTGSQPPSCQLPSSVHCLLNARLGMETASLKTGTLGIGTYASWHRN